MLFIPGKTTIQVSGSVQRLRTMPVPGKLA